MVQRENEQRDIIEFPIVRVLELGQVFASDLGVRTERFVYAHISEGEQLAFLAIVPHHGYLHLGTIDPDTRDFKPIDDPKLNDLSHLDCYNRAANHVVCEVLVRASRLSYIPTLDELLKIEGIIIRRELTPNSNPED